MNPETAVTFSCGHFNQVVFAVICLTPRLAAVQDSDQSEEDLPGPSRLIPPGGHQQLKGVSLSNLEEQQRQYEEKVRRLH